MKATYKPEHIKNVIDLKDSVNYQENSIVSKVFITRENTSITVFAFDKGQKIDAHSAPVDAFVQVLEGEAKITISGEDFIVKEGSFIIMPQGEPHALEALTSFKMLLFKV